MTYTFKKMKNYAENGLTRLIFCSIIIIQFRNLKFYFTLIHLSLTLSKKARSDEPPKMPQNRLVTGKMTWQYAKMSEPYDGGIKGRFFRVTTDKTDYNVHKKQSITERICTNVTACIKNHKRLKNKPFFTMIFTARDELYENKKIRRKI